MMSECRSSAFVSLFAGGVGGTTATVVTCPLEVIKTRLQSSSSLPLPPALQVSNLNTNVRVIPGVASQQQVVEVMTRQPGFVSCATQMYYKEGVRAFFKGLPANLLGVAPARAVYFYAYAKVTKEIIRFGVSKDSPIVHMGAGASAGFVMQSVTSPFWL